MDSSIISFFTQQQLQNLSKQCSYCGKIKIGNNEAASFTLKAEILQPYDYQLLLDNGWRRSGTHLIKHDMHHCCCPPYSIRVKVSEFTPSSWHSKAQKKFDRFVTSINEKEISVVNKELIDEEAKHTFRSCIEKSIIACVGDGILSRHLLQTRVVVRRYRSSRVDDPPSPIPEPTDFPSSSPSLPPPLQELRRYVLHRQQPQHQQRAHRPLEYISSVAFVLASRESIDRSVSCPSPTPHMQREREDEEDRHEKVFKKAVDISEALVKHFFEPIRSSVYADKGCIIFRNFEDTNVDTIAKEERVEEKSESTAVHGDYDELNPPRKRRKLSGEKTTSSRRTSISDETEKATLEVSPLLPPEFVQEAFELYRDYQVAVHKENADDCSIARYKSLLCESPLKNDGKYGTFHQHYRINGELAAVSVFDILPRCVSSVYFFYSQEFSYLSLGTISSLREIQFVRQLQLLQRADIQYYYMGFYVESCHKMQHMGKFGPAQLLCPKRFTWHYLRDVHHILEQQPQQFVILSDIDQSSTLPQIEDTESHSKEQLTFINEGRQLSYNELPLVFRNNEYFSRTLDNFVEFASSELIIRLKISLNNDNN